MRCRSMLHIFWSSVIQCIISIDKLTHLCLWNKVLHLWCFCILKSTLLIKLHHYLFYSLCDITFPLFHFHIYVYIFYVKWVCFKCIWLSLALYAIDNLCFLIEVCRQFIFAVIPDIAGFKYISLFACFILSFLSLWM